MEKDNQYIELNDIDTNKNEPHLNTPLKSKDVENEKISTNDKLNYVCFFQLFCL